MSLSECNKCGETAEAPKNTQHRRCGGTKEAKPREKHKKLPSSERGEWQ